MPVLRDPENCEKWCAKGDAVKDRIYYPRYCSGLVYAITTDLIPGMLKNVAKVPYYFIEDVYITGFLLEHTRGVHYHKINQFCDIEGGIQTFRPYFKGRLRDLKYFILTDYPSDIKLLWNLTLAIHENRLTEVVRKMKSSIM